MHLYALAHPVDVEAHPSIPPGFRWAVYRSDDWSNMTDCLGAGWAPDEGAAKWIADQAATIAVRSMRTSGVPADLSVTSIGYDPVESGHDFVTVGV